MIPIRMLKAARITAAERGDLFLPREQGAERFLLGTINGERLKAIKLDGDSPRFYFEDVNAFNGRRGLIVSDYQVCVEMSSSGRYQGFGAEVAGTLVLDGSNVFLYASDRQTSTYPLALTGDSAEPGDDAVTFSTWKIITVDENGNTVDLFTR